MSGRLVHNPSRTDLKGSRSRVIRLLRRRRRWVIVPMNGDMTLPPHLLHAAEAWGTTKRESTPSALDTIWHSNRTVLQVTSRKVDKKRITNPHLLQVVKPRVHNSDDERSSCLRAFMRLIDLSKRSSCSLKSDRASSSYKRMREADPARLSMTTTTVRSLRRRYSIG
jgi:hypothetical protein